MPLEAPNLDDLRFQEDLVDEARRRIIRYCPEWTDYNLSDPGITLIELFAWMTETMLYRLNRVPEKNYVKFLDLLGVQLRPARSALTTITFYLSTPFPIGSEDDETAAVVARGTEVATRRTEEEEEVIFTTDKRLAIIPPRLVQLRREPDFQRNYLNRLGIETFYAFDQHNPQPGDTFYLGFDENQELSGHILQLTFAVEETEAVGIKLEDPPLVWEASLGDDLWEEVVPSVRPAEKQSIDGLNKDGGRLVLYLPLAMRPDQVHGHRAYWVRCRFEQRRPDQGRYTESPRIQGVAAHTLGATTPATNAVFVYDEVLGRSNGEPGQLFQLYHAPVLALQPAETVQVREKQNGGHDFVSWEWVPDFSRSTHFDRHFTLDTSTGEVCFGPAIRQPDGTIKQYGRIPAAGSEIRFSRYRHGGGMIGNVPAGRVQVLKSAIPYIDRAVNLERAEGGLDPETLEEAKLRAAREMRAQRRAVTAEDYENLSLKANLPLARVKCNTPGDGNGNLPPGMIELIVVPLAAEALRAGDLSKLAVDQDLRRGLRDYLDKYRLLTTTLQVREPNYLGIKVQAEIIAGEQGQSQPEILRARVVEQLRNFINPLPLDPATDGEDSQRAGWPFGRDLYVAEVYSLLQGVSGVKHVLEVHLQQRPVDPRKEIGGDDSTQGEGAGEAEPEQTLTPVTGRMVEVPSDTLLCSLDHEVIIENALPD